MKVAGIKVDWDKAIEWNDRGCDMCDRGEFLEAIDFFKTAIKFNPAYTRAYCNLANCYDTVGKKEEALENYNMALRCASALRNVNDTVNIYEEMAKCYGSLKQKEKVVECLALAKNVKNNL